MDIGKQVHLVRRRNQTPQRTSARSGDAQVTQSVARFVLSLPRSEAALAQRPVSVGDRDPAARSAAVRDALATPGRYLDIGEREQMKARAGADFTDMRLHTDLAAQRSTMEIGVHAYTSGHHIVAGALDRPAPHSVTSHSTPTSATNVPRVQRTPTPTERDAQPVRRLAVHDVLRSQGSPLTQPVRAEMEAHLGADFSTVHIHTDSTAQRSADELGARAYTVGENVVIGAGGIAPHVLAHELTHVIQQRQGPVDGTPQADGLSISDPSDRFEREAERNAVRAMRGTVDVQQATGLTGALVGHVVQRYKRKSDGTGGAPSAKKPKKDPESWPRPDFTSATENKLKDQKKADPAYGDGRHWHGRHIVSFQTMRNSLKTWVDTNYPDDPEHGEMRDKYQKELKDINSKIENLPLGEGKVNSALGSTVKNFGVVKKRILGTFTDSKTRKVKSAMKPSAAFAESSGYSKQHAAEFATPIMEAADKITDPVELQEFLKDVKFSADFDWPGGTTEQFEDWSYAYEQFVNIGRKPGDYTADDIDAVIDWFKALGAPRGAHPAGKAWKDRPKKKSTP